jgi:hypothetical protein
VEVVLFKDLRSESYVRRCPVASADSCIGGQVAVIRRDSMPLGLGLRLRGTRALDALEQMKDQVIEEFASNEQERQVWRKEWPFGT